MLFLTVQSIRLSIAQSWGASFAPEQIRRAIALDPGNPEFHLELGKILLLTGDPASQLAAEREFQTATRLNSSAAQYWLGLGKACYATSDQACADDAFRRARELAPGNPQYAWEAAVNDVVADQPQKAVERLKHFIAMQPDGTDQSCLLLMRGFDSPSMVWNDLLGTTSDPAPKIRFLQYLVRTGNVDVAQEFWRQLSVQQPRIALSDLAPYIDQLLAAEQYPAAAAVWNHSFSQKQDRLADNNAVFNGGFEQLPMNAAFDWRYQQQRYVALNFADTAANEDGRALRVDFTVPQNSEYEVAYHFVPVSPHQIYELTALIKSQRITSDSGLRLRVVDPACNSCLNITTEGTTGTTDWHQISAGFTTGPTTDVVRLSIWRPRSRVYPMEISGQTWLGDVAMRPVQRSSSATQN